MKLQKATNLRATLNEFSRRWGFALLEDPSEHNNDTSCFHLLCQRSRGGVLDITIEPAGILLMLWVLFEPKTRMCRYSTQLIGKLSPDAKASEISTLLDKAIDLLHLWKNYSWHLPLGHPQNVLTERVLSRLLSSSWQVLPL